MKILVTGANGFLGQHLCRFLKDEHEVIATGKGAKRIPFEALRYESINIADETEVRNVVNRNRPDVIIHAAALSKPDECDQQKEQCIDINVNATRHITTAASESDRPVHLVYISSDFVLGENGPHDENAVPAPLNFYGETKLMSEKIVEASALHHTIVRPVFMYGETWEGMRSTFLHWVKDSLQQAKHIKVVSDQQRTPTYVVDICKGIDAVIKIKAKGLYHFSGDETMSPYDMAVRLAEHLNLDASLIEPVTAETFKEPVRRAKTGGVLNAKAKRELDFAAISFAEGLKKTFAFPSNNL